MVVREAGMGNGPRTDLLSGGRRMKAVMKALPKPGWKTRPASCTQRDLAEVTFPSESMLLAWESRRIYPIGPMVLLGHLLAVPTSALPVQAHGLESQESALLTFRRSSRPDGCRPLGKEPTLSLF